MIAWFLDRPAQVFWVCLALTILGVVLAGMLNTLWFIPFNIVTGCLTGNAAARWWLER